MFTSGPFSRDDTLFGVCHALGEDFGFNANILRALFGAGLLFSPVAAIAAYALGAFLVIVSRLLVPDLPVGSPIREAEADVVANEDDNEPQLPLAA